MPVDLQGSYSYSITNGIITLEMDRVVNTSSNTTSGSIRFELWLSPTQYTGGTLNGYRIAEARLDDFPTGGDGRLSPGEGYSNIRFTDPFDENVPDGNYYFVMVVSEYNAGSFKIADYGTFPNSGTVGDPVAPPVDNDIFGTSRSETVMGTYQADDIYGLGGKDNIWAFGGSDRLYGGGGNDTLAGHGGADKLYGGTGSDFADYIIADKGLVVDLENTGKNTGHARGDRYFSIENIRGSQNADKLLGDGGNNTIQGWGGGDRIWGRNGNDKISGQNGQDKLFGGNGRDRLVGGADKDVLTGGNGDDNMSGGSGADRLIGGQGRDVMRGDGGADQFIFGAAAHSGFGNRSDKIADFRLASGDKIVLRPMDANTNAAGNQDFRYIGTNGFHERAGEVRYNNGYVVGDVDGDGRADFRIEVDIADGSRLFADDFIL